MVKVVNFTLCFLARQKFYFLSKNQKPKTKTKPSQNALFIPCPCTWLQSQHISLIKLNFLETESEHMHASHQGLTRIYFKFQAEQIKKKNLWLENSNSLDFFETICCADTYMAILGPLL